MHQLVDDLIVDDARNHNLDVSALVQYLALKGIIDADDFYRYRDEFGKSIIRKRYPNLPDSFFE